MSAERPAVPAGPLGRAPAGFVPRPEREQLLEAVLAGIEMGEYDLRIAAWLAGLDTSTLLTIASWIVRARAAAR